MTTLKEQLATSSPITASLPKNGGLIDVTRDQATETRLFSPDIKEEKFDEDKMELATGRSNSNSCRSSPVQGGLENELASKEKEVSCPLCLLFVLVMIVFIVDRWA